MNYYFHLAGRRNQRGLSIVELMVGVAIGLFILAGATLVASTQLADNRRMLLETQIQQDLRAVADVITRDVRMAGHWGTAWDGLWPVNGLPVIRNPYSAVNTTASSITYSRSKDEYRIVCDPVTGLCASPPYGSPASDSQQIEADEDLGFRLNSSADVKTIDMLVSRGNWQALTDPNVVDVTQFDVALTTQPVSAPCAENCTLGPNGCPLKLLVRDLSIVISARAVHDHNIRRSVQSDVRLRNDVLVEVCS